MIEEWKEFTNLKYRINYGKIYGKYHCESKILKQQIYVYKKIIYIYYL